jgi:ArsR family transcriptional regulator, repressor of sdpIR and other operons
MLAQNHRPCQTFQYLVKCKIMSMVFKALADPTRRRVLELLRKRPMSAGELADHFRVTKSAMSAHFAVLRAAGLVASEKHGKSVVYELQMSVLQDALLSFAQVFGWKLHGRRRAKPNRVFREALNQ